MTRLETLKGFKLHDYANNLFFFFFVLFSESDFPQDASVLAPSSWNTSGNGKYAHIHTHKHRQEASLSFITSC